MLQTKSILPWGIATLALVGAVTLLVSLLKSEQPDDQKLPQAHAKPAKSYLTAHRSKEETKTLAPVSQASSTPLLSKQEEALAFLHDTSVTYDPAELPKIQPYLLSPDAEVQQAAVDAMVVLGDAAAAPMLREASRQTMDTDMVMEMLKAADYLELPPMDVKKMAVLLKNTASGGNKGASNNQEPGRAGIMAKERQKRLGVRAPKEALAPDNSR
jgi:hypothetical protein